MYVMLSLMLSLLMGYSAAEDMEIDLKQEPVTVTFAGDIMMDRSVRQAIAEHGPLYPFTEVRELVSAADYAVANLETAVTGRHEKYPKMYNFKSTPEALDGVKQAGFDLVTLANNHTMDYGIDGLLDTMAYVNSAGLAYIGAGVNSKEAYQDHSVHIKGLHIKFLGISRVLPAGDWFAGKTKRGIASAYDLERVLSVVRRESRNTDYLFVYMHWGYERNDFPAAYQTAAARKLIDAGADGIIGSHPHVLQGLEYYQGKPIAYSLGNFLFPDYVSGKTAETGLLTIRLDGEKVNAAFKPFRIVDDRIIKLSQEEEKMAFNRLQQLSPAVSFQAGVVLDRKTYAGEIAD
ncbi:CapA family protein [Bacillus marinisedimentorum]|uniref:CapA family protein n=1 Tax=Bacillus marinisedimentorum TaxID=1821260 RepID=UPI0007E24FD7|nr:CapA family protein [Bacillus marinisedimentorum]